MFMRVWASMKRIITLAAACLLSALALARAEPTQKELRTRAKHLEQKLKGQGYTVLVEPPFVVIGDSPAAEVKRVTTGFLRTKVALLEKTLREASRQGPRGLAVPRPEVVPQRREEISATPRIRRTATTRPRRTR